MNLVSPRPAARPSHISEAEWKTRVDLAACYRLVHHHGMAMLVYNHITARVPGPEHHILINEFGLAYDEITPSNLDAKIGFLRDYYLSHVTIADASGPLAIRFTTHSLLDVRGGYAQLPFDLDGLNRVPDRLMFDYSVLLDEEPSHRGFLIIEHNKVMTARAFAKAGRTLDEATLNALTRRFIGYYKDNPIAHTLPYPGVVETLTNLKKAGARMAVCTNKFEAPTLQTCRRWS